MTVNPEDKRLFNPCKTAVIVIDMHRGHLDDEATIPVPRGRKIIPKLKEFLLECRKMRISVIHVTFVMRRGGVDFQNPFWNSTKVKTAVPRIQEHNVEGSKWTQIVEGLYQPQDLVVNIKRRYSAFYQTDLELLLKNLGVDTVAIAGVATEICCLCSAFEAMNRDFKVISVKDCTAGFNEENEDFAFWIVDTHLGWVMNSSEFVNLMKDRKLS